MSDLETIGRAETVDLVEYGIAGIPAKIDTGADSSSIWVSQVVVKKDGLHCVFFGPESPYYTGEVVKITHDYKVTRVANSFGHKEMRYKLKLSIRVKGRLIKATFTLSDRSQKTYPILLGRRLLRGKFLVDVTLGEPLHAVEKAKSQRLRHDLRIMQANKETS